MLFDLSLEVVNSFNYHRYAISTKPIHDNKKIKWRTANRHFSIFTENIVVITVIRLYSTIVKQMLDLDVYISSIWIGLPIVVRLHQNVFCV